MKTFGMNDETLFPWAREARRGTNAHWEFAPQAYWWYWMLSHVAKAEVVGEIGVFTGMSAAAMCATPYAKKFVGLDTGGFSGPTWKERVWTLMERNCKGVEVELIEGNSQAVDPGVFPVCDIFSVDADHQYRPVLDDLGFAWQRTRPGGLILLDDYDTEEGVKKAVNDFGQPFTVLPSAKGTAVVFRMGMEHA